MNLNNASFSCRVYSPLTSISLTGHCFPAQCRGLLLSGFPRNSRERCCVFPNGERLAKILASSFDMDCSGLAGSIWAGRKVKAVFGGSLELRKEVH